MKGEQPRADRVRHRYAPGTGDVRLVTASFRTHHFVPHAHGEYAIAVINRGVEAVRYRGADERAGVGDLLLLDAEAIHAGRSAAPQGWDYRVFYVPPGLLTEIAGRRPTFPVAPPRDPELAARLLRVHRMLGEPGTASLPACEQLYQVLARLLARHASRGPAQPSKAAWPTAVRRIQEHLAADIRRPPSLAELAETVGMSRFKLLRVFRSVTGVTPHGLPAGAAAAACPAAADRRPQRRPGGRRQRLLRPGPPAPPLPPDVRRTARAVRPYRAGVQRRTRTPRRRAVTCAG